MLKIGATSWIYMEPIEKTIQRLSRFGYDGIEIPGEPQKINIKNIKEILNSFQLEVPSVAGVYNKERDFINPNEKIRRSAINWGKACIRMIADFNGYMFAAYIPSTVGKLTPLASEEKEWKLAIQSTRELARYAADFNVKIGIEPVNRFETYFINRADQALKLIEDVNMDNVGVQLDTFHMNIEEFSLIDAIKKADEKLVYMHIGDSNRFPPGQGHLNWASIANALKEVKYNDFLILEMLPPIDRTPLKIIPYEKKKKFDEYFIKHGVTARLTDEYLDKMTKEAIEFLRKVF